MSAFPDLIRSALELPDFDVLRARQAMAMLNRPVQRSQTQDGDPRVGAVLCLFYPVQNGAGESMLHLALTKRPDKLRDHSGQVSFPGGRQEADESLPTAALRETWEEIGVPASAITLLGQIDTLYIPPTDFIVYPFIGWAEQRPDFIINEAEVAELLEPTVTHLLDPATSQIAERPIMMSRGVPLPVPYYAVGGHQVWGATAIMLAEILARLQTVLQIQVD